MNKEIEELSKIIKSGIKPKIEIIDVTCIGSSYTCPYYGKYTDEAKKQCNKCWNLYK